MKVKEARVRKPSKCFYRVTCWSCEARPSFYVFGLEDLADSYDCKICGLPMSIATCNTRKEAATVPTRYKTPRGRRRSVQENGHAVPDFLWTIVLILFILVLLRYLGAL